MTPEEFRRRGQPAQGVIPADEGFVTSDRGVGKRHDGLVVHDELLLTDGRAQLGLGDKSRHGLGVHLGVEERPP